MSSVRPAEARFTCPHCGASVTEVGVSPIPQMYTAAANGLHRGLGHSVGISAGKVVRYVVRCGSDPALVPAALAFQGEVLVPAGGPLKEPRK